MNLEAFAHPDVLWLLLLLPIMLVGYVLRYRSNYGTIKLSGLSGFQTVRVSVLEILRHGLLLLRLAAICLLVIALARPQSALSWKEITSKQ